MLSATNLSPRAAYAVRRIVVDGFQALWTGDTPAPSELGSRIDAGAEAVAHLVAGGRIELSPDGRVVGIHGTRRSTRHRIEHTDGAINTWCALDAIGIPAALGIDARAMTRCPICRRQLPVTIVAGEPEPLDHAVLWYPTGCCDHLVDDFCAAANLFCSVAHLEQWSATASGDGRPMAIDEAARLGRDCWQDAAEAITAPGEPGGDARGPRTSWSERSRAMRPGG